MSSKILPNKALNTLRSIFKENKINTKPILSIFILCLIILSFMLMLIEVFSKTTNSNTATKTAIKECLNNRCPLSSGEKIKHQCGKIDDFAETIGILSGVNEVMRDMVCAR